MAIKGLVPRLNESGKIKIGMRGEEIKTANGKSMRLPKRLDHFIITTTEKNSNGDFVEDIKLSDSIATKEDGAIINEAGELVAIPIRLIYNDTELNFPTRMACYSGGILTCEGDGEKARKRMDDFKKDYTCPCSKSDPTYDGKDKCKPNGKLTVVIDAAGMFGQVHVFRTTSYNSINGIMGGIALIKAATGGKIAGLPLMLTVNNKTTTTPKGEQTTIQVVSVCYRGTMADLQKKCLEITSEHAQFLIGMKTIEDEARKIGVNEVVPADEDIDFQEEFYPQSVMDAEFVETSSETVQENPKVQIGVAVNPEPVVETEPVSTTQPQHEIVNSRDIMTDDQKAMAEKSQEKVKKEMIQLGLFHRLVKESDQTEASKLARRLDKELLVKFIETMGNDDDMPQEGAKKPDYLESAERIINSDDWAVIVAEYISKNGIKNTDNDTDSNGNHEQERSEIWKTNKFLSELAKIEKQPDIVAYMRKRFLDTVVNGTLPPEDLYTLAERWIVEESEEKNKQDVEKVPESVQTNNAPDPVFEPELNPFVWDDGGTIQEAQLKHIAKLKSELKITDPVKWSAMVGKYLDKSGNPLPLAAKMTSKQADHFLNFLDEIPF